MGGIGGRKNGVSQGTINNGASKDLILVHTEQLKPMIKAHISGRPVSSGINDVVITTVYSEKTRLELMKMMMKMMMSIIIVIMNKLQ